MMFRIRTANEVELHNKVHIFIFSINKSKYILIHKHSLTESELEPRTSYTHTAFTIQLAPMASYTAYNTGHLQKPAAIQSNTLPFPSLILSFRA